MCEVSVRFDLMVKCQKIVCMTIVETGRIGNNEDEAVDGAIAARRRSDVETIAIETGDDHVALHVAWFIEDKQEAGVK